jgi:hypothetical protein
MLMARAPFPDSLFLIIVRADWMHGKRGSTGRVTRAGVD